MIVQLDTSNLEDYRKFLKIKRFPKYKIVGRTAVFPDEYSHLLNLTPDQLGHAGEYDPLPGLWDYQEGISRIIIGKEKFALFAECGMGKTMIYFEYVRHVLRYLNPGEAILIVAPLMVVKQIMSEARRFYGDSLPMVQVASGNLDRWLAMGTEPIGVTNYEAMRPEVRQGRLRCLVLDESSMLKSFYGKWGTECIRLGQGLRWKLAGTGTPAPNDRVEFANHAVFLDQFPNVNSFLAKYFVNKGQTDNRWEMKAHAVGPFYRELSHWSIFLTDPSTYGWKDNCGGLPPINIKIHDIGLTQEQSDLAYRKQGWMFPVQAGGITSRSRLSQIAKGNNNGVAVATLKDQYIVDLVNSEPDRSTIIWCEYNPEQEKMAKLFPDAANIAGNTPLARRETLIEDFQRGRRKVLISKAKILGLGLNLQISDRHIFSGIQDSYEKYWQCIKRSNRPGSVNALDVHIPVTPIERPMLETVLKKANRVREDTAEQEREFRKNLIGV